MKKKVASVTTRSVSGEEVEDATPVEDDEQLRADDRSQDRRQPVDQREPGQHPHQGQPAEQVANHRHRHHATGSRADALQDAEQSRGRRCRGPMPRPTLAATCTVVARISGSRRPTRSLHGPTSSCPSPKPTAVAVSVSWMIAVDTPKSASSAGKGRQVEVDGERAERGQRAAARGCRPTVAVGRASHPGGQRWSRAMVLIWLGGGRSGRPST